MIVGVLFLDFKMLTIAELRETDVVDVTKAFAVLNKNEQQYRRYFAEHEALSRFVLVARSDDAIAGYVTIVWQSDMRRFTKPAFLKFSTSTCCPIFDAIGLVRGSRKKPSAS
jgi:hypothetical protein